MGNKTTGSKQPPTQQVGTSALLSADFDCSGIVTVKGGRACKHGFPYHPSCNHEPMKPGVYKNAPCMNENTSARLYPETGKPEQLCR